MSNHVRSTRCSAPYAIRWVDRISARPLSQLLTICLLMPMDFNTAVWITSAPIRRRVPTITNGIFFLSIIQATIRALIQIQLTKDELDL